mmetsp:Transcript_14730/g.30292  ORF Transcript_14730/g.30292 Transcript_14730/m.30292 type:complete len:230 (+) Transcript_14730:564-1253(+)
MREKMTSCMTLSKVALETILPFPLAFCISLSFFPSSRPFLEGFITAKPPLFAVWVEADVTRSLMSSSTSATVATLLPAASRLFLCSSLLSTHSFLARLTDVLLSSRLWHQSSNDMVSWKLFRLFCTMKRRKSRLVMVRSSFSSSSSDFLFSSRASILAWCKILCLSSSSMTVAPRACSAAIALRRETRMPSFPDSHCKAAAETSRFTISLPIISKESIMPSQKDSGRTK